MRIHAAALVPPALSLLICPARAAVMTSSLRVSGAQPPYAVSYVLGQDVTRLTVTIRAAEDGRIVRTFSSLGANVEVLAADMKQGRHPNALLWDGRMDNGQAAPPGTYYAHALTVGNGASTMRLLNFAALPFAPAPGRTEARGLYGGGVNNDPASPFHNLAYFAVTATNAAGSAGLEVVDADGSSALFPLPEATATGAYDYISASVLDDGSVLVAGQTWQRLTLVNPATGAAQGTYAAGQVNGRTLKTFGAGPSARAYYVSADETGVYLLSPLTGSPVRIVPAALLPGAARGLEVRADESALYVSGDGGYVRRFNRPASGTTWTLDTAFNPPATTGEVRGVALSPNGTVLWVANNSTSDATRNRVFGINAATGAAYPAAYQVSFGSDLTPQGIAVAANGNLFVEGWRGGATGTSANAVAVVAPPEGATTDQTVSNTFTRPASAGSVTLSAGPSVSGLAYSGATIVWNTTVPASATVQIGTAPGVYTRTVSGDAAPNLATRHAVSVDGLDPNRTYHYRVLSAADGYATALSAASSFITPALTLSGVQISDVTDTTARLRWTTSAPATTGVRYGPAGAAMDRDRSEGSLSLSHDVTLTGLTPGAAWEAVPVSGAGGASAPASGNAVTFATLKAARLLTQRLAVGTSTATLSWETSEPLAATVRYGAAPDALDASVHTDAALSGEAALSGLPAGATCYYQVAFTGDGVAPFTTPVAAFATETEEGAVRTVSTTDPAELRAARRVNVDLGVDGHVATLQKQAVPGAPVTTTPLPGPRYHHAVVAHNGYLYALGGFDADGAATSTVFYAPILADGTVGAWAATTPLPAPRVGITDMAAGYGGRLYVVGGADAAFNSLSGVLVARQNADGTLGDWAETTDLPLPNGRDGGTVTAAGGTLYLTGGEDNVSNPAMDRSVYAAPIRADGRLGDWSVAGAVPDPARGIRARYGAGSAYAFGGFLPGDDYNERALLAGLAPSGSLTPFLREPQAMAAARYGFAAALTGGKLIALAGRVRPATFSRALEFASLSADGAVGAWSVSAEQAPEAVDALDGEEYDGRIYTVGGRLNNATGPSAGATDAVVMVPMAPAPGPAGADYAYAGTLESPVLDLGETTNLRRLAVTATGEVRARYRFAGPGGVFSQWYTPAADGAISGGARYVQYALTLAGDGTATPVVDAVTIIAGPAAGTVMVGDVDRDGRVTRVDAALALQLAGGFLPAADASVSLPNADADGDGQVTLADAAAIARRAE